jgi:hypothetical protein
MRGATKRRAAPFVLALLVLAFTLPLAWIGATPFEADCVNTIPADELGKQDTVTSLWPPGVRCTSRLADGREFEATYITWYEMTIACLAAASTWLVSAALLGVIPVRTFGVGVLAIGAALIVASAVFLA